MLQEEPDLIRARVALDPERCLLFHQAQESGGDGRNMARNGFRKVRA
jgi:hypothetical protein